MCEDLQRKFPPGIAGPAVTLTIAAGLCCAVWTARVVCTWNVRQGFLVWNLVLACAPMVFALLLARAQATGAPRWRSVAAGAAWLLFLPNAPYILTDVVHLRGTAHSGFWTELLLILLFGWTGAFAGFLSLLVVHRAVVNRCGSVAGWLAVGLTVVMCGIGVYLGRFERWNSWDILFQPGAIIRDVALVVTAGGKGRLFIALFTSLMLVGYVTMFSLVGAEGRREARLRRQVGRG